MKVSVIIPAYNEEKYIAHALTALRKQSCQDFEVIVVDNKSSDATGKMVRQFPEVKLLQATRQGVQFAREQGRKEASGEIIINLDADCIPGPTWIQNGLAYFQNAKVVAVSGPYVYFDASIFFRFGSYVIQHFIFNFFHKICTFIFHHGAIGTGGNIFIRASALKAIGGYNTDIAFYGDDTDTANRLSSQGVVLYKTNLAIRSSARRFQRQGIFTTLRIYLVNYIWIVLFKKPYNSTLND